MHAVTYEGIGVDFDALMRVIARVLRRPSGRALVAHETRMMASQRIAADGGDPAIAKLRRCATTAGLECATVYSDRPRFGFAASGQRSVLEFTFVA
jgi:hypothetical protein